MQTSYAIMREAVRKHGFSKHNRLYGRQVMSEAKSTCATDVSQIPSNPRFINLTSQRFGRLIVSEFAGYDRKGHAFWWKCCCDCGNICKVRGQSLRRGETKSCGCLSAELSSTRNATHGKTKTTEYKIWAGMIQRCMNSAINNYADYGGRGISVCRGARSSFEAFFRDMGPRRPAISN